MTPNSLTEAILAELEITQGTAENIAIILKESPAAVKRVLETLLRGDEVRLYPHPSLRIYRHNRKATANNPTK